MSVDTTPRMRLTPGQRQTYSTRHAGTEIHQKNNEMSNIAPLFHRILAAIFCRYWP